MNRRGVLASVALAGVFSVLLFPQFFPASGPLEQVDRAGSKPALPNVTVGTRGPDYPSHLVASGATDVPDQLPASLQGTLEPSGWKKTDANGRLVPSPELRQLFEYYLSALGEEALPQLVARIEKALSALAEPARSQALNILGAYLDFKLELGAMEAPAVGVGDLNAQTMAAHFSRIRSLRRRWLDAETAEAFFALDEAVDDLQLTRIRINADESLSEDVRLAQLREAEQSLPEPLRKARQETRKFAEYQQARERLGDDPRALQKWREDAFGADAARRLEQADVEQQAWDRRWQSYLREKALLEQSGLAGPERKVAIERLRERIFEGPERYRAEALDSLQ